MMKVYPDPVRDTIQAHAGFEKDRVLSSVDDAVGDAVVHAVSALNTQVEADAVKYRAVQSTSSGYRQARVGAFSGLQR